MEVSVTYLIHPTPIDRNAYPLSIINVDLLWDTGTFEPCQIPHFNHNVA
jgi:hypothetical protein